MSNPTNNPQNSSILYQKLKQNFLQDQITAQSQTDFSRYLSSKKPDGTDIDSWNYQELIAIVEEFKDLTNSNSEYKVIILNEEVTKDSWFSPTVKTYTIELTQNFFPDPDSDLSRTRTKWRVKRTTQHFLWLREIILKNHPASYVPPVECDSNFVGFYQNFLYRLINRKLILEFEPLGDFLKLEMIGALDLKYDYCRTLNRFFESDNELVLELYASLIKNEKLNMKSIPPVSSNFFWVGGWKYFRFAQFWEIRKQLGGVDRK
jgi:hypothetical protein